MMAVLHLPNMGTPRDAGSTGLAQALGGERGPSLRLGGDRKQIRHGGTRSFFRRGVSVCETGAPESRAVSGLPGELIGLLACR